MGNTPLIGAVLQQVVVSGSKQRQGPPNARPDFIGEAHRQNSPLITRTTGQPSGIYQAITRRGRDGARGQRQPGQGPHRAVRAHSTVSASSYTSAARAVRHAWKSTRTSRAPDTGVVSGAADQREYAVPVAAPRRSVFLFGLGSLASWNRQVGMRQSAARPSLLLRMPVG